MIQHKSLNQLLCAATVNGRFREMLLRDPAQAIAAGYFDHSFCLSPEERDLVVGIQAGKLEDFAAQVYCWMSGSGNGANGYNGYNGQNGHNGHNGRNGHNGHNGFNGRNGNGVNGHSGRLEQLASLATVS